MGRWVAVCPDCGTENEPMSLVCAKCGARLSDSPVEDGVKETTDQGPLHVPILGYILAAVAVFLLVVGFFGADNAITQTALFAAAAVVGILARMAQASSQHRHLIEELRRLQKQ